MNKIMLVVVTFFMCFSYLDASIVVMDSDSGRVLYNKNMNEEKLIASTTKIMTAIVAIEHGNLNDIYTVGNEISTVYGSMTYIKENESISLESLLYGLLLVSGNDASMVIANNVLGYDNFINEMNRKALSIGMNNTNYENPHGLNDETSNYSTAYDLSLLMKYAIKNKTFMKISSTKKYKVKTNMNEYIWYNKNKLLSNYKYTTSGKIGYTKSSGQVFVSSASKDNKNLIIVSIDESNKFELHESLYKKYFDLYDKYTLLDKHSFSINNLKYKDYYMYINKDVKMLLNKNEINNISIKAVINNELSNNIAGSINVYLYDKIIYKEKLYYENYYSKINRIKSFFK